MLVVALLGVAGATVASGQVGRIMGAGPSPTPSATPTPTSTPTATRTPSPRPTPEPPPPPVSPAAAPCATAVTMSVWAHYDDDLIFANPVLQDAMASGECVRTVFVTASDAGRGMGYSQGRELGILRAYNTMRGQEGFWSENRVTLLSGAELSQFSPDGDPDVTIAFLRLPDGNLNGDGFSATGHAALPKLLSGVIADLAPVTGAPALSSEGLVLSLAELIQAYDATRLFTHVPSDSAEWSAGDHPDHAATGTYARAAWQRAGFPAGQVLYAIGYPTASLPANVGGDVLSQKIAAFRTYAAQDSVVTCATDAACLAKPRFGEWLQRTYLKSEPELFPAD